MNADGKGARAREESLRSFFKRRWEREGPAAVVAVVLIAVVTLHCPICYNPTYNTAFTESGIAGGWGGAGGAGGARQPW